MRHIILTILFSFSLSHAQAEEFTPDIRQLTVFKTVLNDMFREMFEQKNASSRQEKGYISNIEHDQIENLLFRFLICRRSLWEIINKYRAYNTFTDDPEANMKAFVIGYSAALTLYRYSGILVTTYMDDDQIVNKLNESYYRVKIPEGTFSKIFDSLTNPKNLEDLDVARELFIQELHTSETPLNALLSNPEFSPMLDELENLHETHIKLRDKILNHYVFLTPELTNQLRHSEIQKNVETLIDDLGSRFQAIKATVFTGVGDLKSPTSQSIQFSEGQKLELHSLLKPGDIILTYSEGYMSNIFLPGTFKHGIIYTGKRNEWKTIQLDEMNLPAHQSTMINENDDMIEAVSEGVVSSSMYNILDRHINRMVVFRPLEDLNQIRMALQSTHSFLGNSYDFEFDFNDASFQVCTELIYRAYNGKGNIQFNLTKRAGVMTLSADDVCRYALESDEMVFIVLAVEDSRKPGKADLLTGKNGFSVLRSMID
ncbi:MAG: hypothetical protein HN647_08195 [Candidatus Marinimicrobia bacterium]|jgi:uncharacterized protein YycO|nr:hypothetical protein [Candidatus Neomarinimicrobiota bacterium]MBT6709281.1 hypothetical protein [Candidatus Neomarinimicrobiota bacterium]MBT7112283.1 hypothetical protein [Candidatus Neomarinimicrobiota bacterium]MBT7986525.1 hypothetical protein [Candidatus Neomarinimicrobiota bacterium]